MVPVPPIYSARVAIIALTLVHVLFSAEITNLNFPIDTVNIGSDDINGRAKNSYYAYFMLTFLNPRKGL